MGVSVSIEVQECMHTIIFAKLEAVLVKKKVDNFGPHCHLFTRAKKVICLTLYVGVCEYVYRGVYKQCKTIHLTISKMLYFHSIT